MKICRHPRKSKEEAYRAFTSRQNKTFHKKFSEVPTSQRIIFVPHCMRKTQVCKAVEKDGYYCCARCGACKIGAIAKLADSLGYPPLLILKGGRAILRIVKEAKPRAVVGVACFFEGDQAFRMLREYDPAIAVQFIPLTKDGCSDTDADLGEIGEKLKI